MKSFGFDPMISLSLPQGANPDIRQRVWQEPGDRYPILCSEWNSPAGTLTSRLRKSDDYYDGDKVSLFGDLNTPRYVKPLFAAGEDMRTFINMDPFRTFSGDQLSAWRERCRDLECIADKEQIAVCVSGGTALDYLIWSARAEEAVLLAVDYPEGTDEFLAYVNRRSEEALAVCLEELPVDFVIRRGWYDSTDFWNPDQFARFAAPYIRREVDLVHQSGIPCCYLMCTGIMPLLSILAELDFDCLMSIEPVCTGQDLRQIEAVLGASKSFWTGLSAPMHIGLGSEEDVRQAVREAFEIFGTTGILLDAVPSVRRHWPAWRENLMAMVDESRKISRYHCQTTANTYRSPKERELHEGHRTPHPDCFGS